VAADLEATSDASIIGKVTLAIEFEEYGKAGLFLFL